MSAVIPEALAARLDGLLAGAERPLLVAIDGPCGSGKTTLAGLLGARYAANVFHCDDYFPRPEQRTPERLGQPGGNLDRERLAEEILTPIRAGLPARWRRFDCKTLTLGEFQTAEPTALNIVEGSYALHPELACFYDLTVFLTCDPKTQLARLAARGSDLAAFQSRWIPMEKRYFAALEPEKQADIITFC